MEKEDKSQKFRMSTLPVAALVETAKVFQWVINHGKYKEDDWRKGVSWKENYNSMMRHATAYYNREDFDSETGLLHLAHLSDRVVMALEMQLKGVGIDDRYHND